MPKSGNRASIRKTLAAPAAPKKPRRERAAGVMQHQGRERKKATRFNFTFPFSLSSLASLTSILLIIIFSKPLLSSLISWSIKL